MYTVFLHTQCGVSLCVFPQKKIRQSSFHRIPLIIFTDTSSLKYLWIAEGFGKQIRFPNIIRRRNSLPPRKTVGFKAFAAEPICLFLCYNKLKPVFNLIFLPPKGSKQIPSAPLRGIIPSHIHCRLFPLWKYHPPKAPASLSDPPSPQRHFSGSAAAA